MRTANEVTLLRQSPRRVTLGPERQLGPVLNRSPNAPRIRWTIPLGTTDPAGTGVELGAREVPHSE
jgi:hypothetical protein